MAYKEIKAKFRTDFVSRISGVASTNVFLDNTYATQKDNGVWVVLTVLEGEGGNISNGTTITHRHPGVMVAKCLCPTGSASLALETLVQEILTDYSNLNLAVGDSEGSVIKFRAGYVTRVGRVDGKYQLNVNVPYHFDLT